MYVGRGGGLSISVAGFPDDEKQDDDRESGHNPGAYHGHPEDVAGDEGLGLVSLAKKLHLVKHAGLHRLHDGDENGLG